MTRRRWIADEVSGNRAALVGAHAQHLAQVLRGRVGQEFDIATGEKSAAVVSSASPTTGSNLSSAKSFLPLGRPA